jgi:hypothetical protein
MAHAFETINQYKEFAEQCEVQASFATSPAERDYFVKQAATFRHLAKLRAPQASRAPHALHSDQSRQTDHKPGSWQETMFYDIAG